MPCAASVNQLTIDHREIGRVGAGLRPALRLGKAAVVVGRRMGGSETRPYTPNTPRARAIPATSASMSAEPLYT